MIGRTLNSSSRDFMCSTMSLTIQFSFCYRSTEKSTRHETTRSLQCGLPPSPISIGDLSQTTKKVRPDSDENQHAVVTRLGIPPRGGVERFCKTLRNRF